MADHKLYNLACTYADAGLKLLWFRLDKTPGIAWSSESTSDKSVLKQWFYDLEPGQRRIGIKTGQDSRGVIVIDIDVNKKDKLTGNIADTRSAEEKKEYIREAYGELPDTLEVSTPSGGRHLYYIADRPVATLKKIFPGDPIDIDVRGDGGVVVAPDELDYLTDGDFDISSIAPLPEWMYEIISRRNPLTRTRVNEYTGGVPLIPEMEKAIADAFMFLDYSDRDLWVKAGHAVKSLNSDDAKRLWLEWSQQHGEHDHGYAEDKWESFIPAEITIATLFYDAKQKGYQPEDETLNNYIREQEIAVTTGNIRPRYEVRTMADALAPHPPVEWIVQDLMLKGSVCMITGDAGSGKTWTSMDVAMCIALGKPWLGRNVIQGAVLLVDEESGEHRLSNRLTKISAGHGGNESSPLFYITMQGVDLRNALDVNELEKIITAMQIKFVVMDALMDMMLGADENSVKDVIPAFAQLKQVVERTGVTFLVIHHNDKAGKGYRGSTAIKGAVDLMVEVEKNNDTVKIKTNKIRDAEPTEIKAKMLFSDYTFTMEPDETRAAGDKLSLTKGEKIILEYLMEKGVSLKMDIESEGKRLCCARSVHDGIYSLQKKGYIGRANADAIGAKAEYGIIDKKKIEVELLLETGYVMGNLEEKN
jgi:KaiC/GvpD/RAD55 family RecA-like ATPase